MAFAQTLHAEVSVILTRAPVAIIRTQAKDAVNQMKSRGTLQANYYGRMGNCGGISNRLFFSKQIYIRSVEVEITAQRIEVVGSAPSSSAVTLQKLPVVLGSLAKIVLCPRLPRKVDPSEMTSCRESRRVLETAP